MPNENVELESSWQEDYLEHNWQYKVYRSVTLPSGFIAAPMNSNTLLFPQPLEVYGLLHAFTVTVAGSLDLRNADLYATEISAAGTAQAVFYASPKIAEVVQSIQPLAVPIATSLDDVAKIYSTFFVPASPYPVHRLQINLITPPPTLDPAITQAAITYDVVTSVKLMV